ncbi:MAG: AAA family ATPase [Candidatus Bathyarchaeia archaeon]|nr:AAA family ATPase [Candidatus Bathyarchaeota archaeon]MDI9577409.1 AAA family ATPase [Thermoproteota archaeon]MDT8782839.1 AAA family ATPase [Candidatus Bathyarchaeota archaeon]NLD66798.1 AAA family ATPase [Thermoproteota archaeon]
MKIAVSGKGGVGKTLIAGGLARGFVERGLKTIAIDADSSPNLGLTLGLSTEQTRKIVPVSENKELVDSKTSTGYTGVYNLNFTVDDIVKQYSVPTPLDVNLIVMGTVQSMGSGCMCAPNAVIRALLRHLVVERNEAVVLDFEAGVEHIGRGTAKQVDALLIVADSNLKSLEIAKHIHDLAAAADMKQLYLIGNRVMNDEQKDAVTKFAKENSMELLTFVPWDQKVIEADMLGVTPLKNKEIAAVKAIDGICDLLLKKTA